MYSHHIWQGYDASGGYDDSGYDSRYDQGGNHDDRYQKGSGMHTKKRLVPSEPSPHVIFLGLDPDFTESDVRITYTRLISILRSQVPLLSRHHADVASLSLDASLLDEQQLQHRVGHHNPRQIYRHLPILLLAFNSALTSLFSVLLPRLHRQLQMAQPYCYRCLQRVWLCSVLKH